MAEFWQTLLRFSECGHEKKACLGLLVDKLERFVEGELNVAAQADVDENLVVFFDDGLAVKVAAQVNLGL